MIHVINLPNRTDRLRNIQREFSNQGTQDYMIWNGIIHTTNPTIGIAKAHQQIVEFAKQNNLQQITICEDDVQFTSNNSIKYYFSQLPHEYDLYLGSLTSGIIANKQVNDFSGLTFYTISRTFYDTFLNISGENNLDRSLKGLGKYIVCDPIVAIQHYGYSDNLKTYCDYRNCFKQYQLYS